MRPPVCYVCLRMKKLLHNAEGVLLQRTMKETPATETHCSDARPSRRVARSTLSAICGCDLLSGCVVRMLVCFTHTDQLHHLWYNCFGLESKITAHCSP